MTHRGRSIQGTHTHLKTVPAAIRSPLRSPRKHPSHRNLKRASSTAALPNAKCCDASPAPQPAAPMVTACGERPFHCATRSMQASRRAAPIPQAEIVAAKQTKHPLPDNRRMRTTWPAKRRHPSTLLPRLAQANTSTRWAPWRTYRTSSPSFIAAETKSDTLLWVALAGNMHASPAPPTPRAGDRVVMK
jgi:hypothetical protein